MHCATSRVLEEGDVARERPVLFSNLGACALERCGGRRTQALGIFDASASGFESPTGCLGIAPRVVAVGHF